MAILFAESNENVQANIRQAFSKFEKDIIIVSDLKGAIEAINNNHFSLHLINLFLPQEKGSGKKEMAGKLLFQALCGIFWNHRSFGISRLVEEFLERWPETKKMCLAEFESELSFSPEQDAFVENWARRELSMGATSSWKEALEASLGWYAEAEEARIPNGLALYKMIAGRTIQACRRDGTKAGVFVESTSAGSLPLCRETRGHWLELDGPRKWENLAEKWGNYINHYWYWYRLKFR